MAKQAAIEQDGTIMEALSNAMFRVELENGVDIYTKGVLRYPKAICSFKVGLGVKTEGKHAVVIGRSAIVGKPAALLLLEANCTVFFLVTIDTPVMTS